jgi:two-component system, sensor histidine kinase
VRLPLANGAALPSSPAAPPPDVAPQRVLVVEDNDDGREMLVSLLRVLGHEVLEAGAGKEGIEIAVRHSPDVVVLDIGLPDVDGYEVGRHLRERLGRGCRLVALTGYGQPQDRALSVSGLRRASRKADRPAEACRGLAAAGLTLAPGAT